MESSGILTFTLSLVPVYLLLQWIESQDMASSFTVGKYVDWMIHEYSVSDLIPLISVGRS